MKVTPPSDKGSAGSPVTAFVLLERFNAIKLIQVVHASLASLSKVIRGTQLLTSDVQALAAALMNQEVTDGNSFTTAILIPYYYCNKSLY